jgi:hypothetical protein
MKYLPEIGQIICLHRGAMLGWQLFVMETGANFDDLVRHLERTLGLERAAAARVIDEVLAYFQETVDEFVVRRHGELQAESQRNQDIFGQITAELGQRRFAAPALTQRQIRRLIYG